MTTLAIAAGQGHALALRSDGTVWAWGENAYGPLGVPSVGLAEFPLRVAGLSNIVSMAAGADHSLAVQSNGRYGPGERTIPASLEPAISLGAPCRFKWWASPTPWRSLAEAMRDIGSHSLALLSNGMVMGWGYNGYGQVRKWNLHHESNACRCAWIEQCRADQGRRISFNGVDDERAGMVLGLRTGRANGQWGKPYNVNAVQTLTVSNIVSIAAGGFHNLALKSDGTLWAWGYNADGELGLGTTNNLATATQVSTLAHVTTIGASTFSSAATLAPTTLTGTNAQTMVWGYEYYTTPYALGQAPPFTQLAPVSSMTRAMITFSG